MEKNDYKGIWVFAEQKDGTINPGTYEILGKAQELKAHTGEEICAVLLGDGREQSAEKLIAYGADKVISAENASLREYSARPYQQAVTQLAKKYLPSIILFAATPIGRDLAPRVMVSLETGLTADAVDLVFDEDDVFCQTTPAYGGNIMAHIAIPEKRPQMATVRTGIFSPIKADRSRTGSVIKESVDVQPDDDYEIIRSVKKETSDTPVGQAKIIVSGGRGIKSAEEFSMLEELAELLNGVTASSRPLVEDGLLPHSKQIGQSGETVKPELIINVGISGSTQYMIGMKDSDCIISINKDKNARIFDISDYGAVADLRTLLPAIIRELKKRVQNEKGTT